MTTPGPGSSPSVGLGLNDILNILWRRRLLILAATVAGALAGVVYGQVVTPLHIAKATVQPGITHYDDRAQPHREWNLKDIAQWYKRGNQHPHLAVAMGKDPQSFRPIIRAEFIPRGPQSRGGNTIALSTLDADPDEARLILERSVDVFNAFAGSDTAFSNIHIMRRQIAANIDKQRSRVAQVEGKRAKARLDIAAAQADIAAEEASKRLVEEQIDELENSVALVQRSILAHEDVIARIRQDAGNLGAKVDEWERLGEQLTAERDSILSSRRGDDSAALLVFASSLGDIISDVGELRLGLFDQADRQLEWDTSLRELQLEVRDLEKRIQELVFERDITIPRNILTLEQQAAALQLELDYDIPFEEQEAIQNLRAMRTRLASLTPLELIGEAVASTRPVRPRKQRAILILTGLAFLSSIFGAFTLEYLSQNWRQITRGSRDA